MPTIVHFEIPSDNVDRSKRFYSDLFGWNIEKISAYGY
jgi:predicted enzyme related to lactoylglutathione lyase